MKGGRMVDTKGRVMEGSACDGVMRPSTVDPCPLQQDGCFTALTS
jgi:hypothetical protein